MMTNWENELKITKKEEERKLMNDERLLRMTDSSKMTECDDGCLKTMARHSIDFQSSQEMDNEVKKIT